LSNSTHDIAYPLQAGTAKLDITPPIGIAMQGYGARYARGIADPTFATALAIRKERIEWLLLTVDVIGLDRAFTNRVRNSIARRLGISPTGITLISSHTHSGPATLPRLSVVRADKNYLKFLESKLVTAAESATMRFQPVSWHFGMTTLTENVNRRLRVDGGIQLGVDSTGPADQRLRILRLDTVEGPSVPLALIVHYACHATTSGDSLEISADWPGAMRNHIRTYWDHDPAVLFLQGCTGNLTHRIGRDAESWPDHFGHQTTIESEELGKVVGQACIQASERSEELHVTEVAVAVKPIVLPFHNRRGSETTEVQLARIGQKPHLPGSRAQAVWFVGLPGEPFTEYSTDFGSEFHHHLHASMDRTLVCGYTNDCVGYFCTPEALEEGGYEAAAAHRVYHRPAPFSRNVKSLLLNCSLETAQAVEQSPSLLTSAWKQTISELAGRTIRILSGPKGSK